MQTHIHSHTESSTIMFAYPLAFFLFCTNDKLSLGICLKMPGLDWMVVPVSVCVFRLGHHDDDLALHEYVLAHKI